MWGQPKSQAICTSSGAYVAADYGDANCFTNGDAEIEYTYDSLAGCPTGTCVNGLGRLLMVETQMACLDTEADDALDQQTYYGYDNAGRLVTETITDDGGRTAPQSYEWDKNSNPVWFYAPSGTKMGWDYNYTDSATSANSDRDKQIRVRRNDSVNTYITTDGRWFPFGPMKQYRHYNQISTSAGYVKAFFTWDSAYRSQQIQYRTTTTSANVFTIDQSYDADGNIAKRDYTGGASSLQDAFYTYDGLDRVTTDCAVSGTCSTADKKSAPVFNTSGDRMSIFHDNGWGDETESIPKVWTPCEEGILVES